MRRFAIAMFTVASISLSSIAWADVMGDVNSFSPEARTVTVDGKTFSIPEGVEVDWGELSDGDRVTIFIDETDDEKRVTGILVWSDN
jgi:hypothetical protein